MKLTKQALMRIIQEELELAEQDAPSGPTDPKALEKKIDFEIVSRQIVMFRLQFERIVLATLKLRNLN